MDLDPWQPALPPDIGWLAPAVDSDLGGPELRAALPELVWTEVLHPAHRLFPDGRAVEVRWQEIGSAAGREPRPGVHFDALVGLPVSSFENGIDDPDGVWTLPPAQGSLPRALADRLRELLSRHTASSEAYVGVWAGWSVMAPYRSVGVPRATAFGREYLLFRTPLHVLSRSVDEVDHQSANLWYPGDHRWLLVTDVDHWSTFVGGSRDLAGKLLGASGIEARAV